MGSKLGNIMERKNCTLTDRMHGTKNEALLKRQQKQGYSLSPVWRYNWKMADRNKYSPFNKE
jgi:hypothetical protein